MNEIRKTCITGKLPPPVGTSEWETFSQKCICVDKTRMIKELVDRVTTVALFTRPRRFGKTTALKMIRAFFEKRLDGKGKKVDTSYLFKDNAHVEMGLMTGVLRVAKEGILSGLNNLKVYTVFDAAAERIREVFDTQYRIGPEGLCGNDDCGQMSAWYVFSAMGFYPFNPCGGEYVIGAPQMPRVTMEVGKRTPVRFTMTAKNLSKENKYVKSVTLNGRPITDWKIRHTDIVNGGELVFEMERIGK